MKTAARPSAAAAPRSSRAEYVARVLQTVRADLAGYRQLRELLDSQFEAALRHQSAALQEVAEQITALVDVLEQRREERVALVAKVTGQPRPDSMEPIFKLLNESSRTSVEGMWRELEHLVVECKALNARNCQLLMDQHEIMQRVLNGEVDTYAPR